MFIKSLFNIKIPPPCSNVSKFPKYFHTLNKPIYPENKFVRIIDKHSFNLIVSSFTVFLAGLLSINCRDYQKSLGVPKEPLSDAVWVESTALKSKMESWEILKLGLQTPHLNICFGNQAEKYSCLESGPGLGKSFRWGFPLNTRVLYRSNAKLSIDSRVIMEAKIDKEEDRIFLAQLIAEAKEVRTRGKYSLFDNNSRNLPTEVWKKYSQYKDTQKLIDF